MQPERMVGQSQPAHQNPDGNRIRNPGHRTAVPFRLRGHASMELAHAGVVRSQTHRLLAGLGPAATLNNLERGQPYGSKPSFRIVDVAELRYRVLVGVQ